ncbi:MAG: hypothetical protein R6V85_00335 [Polyangia bacterium]
MHRTSVMLPIRLKKLAEDRARDEGVSLGELIRRSLAREVEPGEGDDPSSDAFFADDAVFEGETPADLSLRHDDFIYGNDN